MRVYIDWEYDIGPFSGHTWTKANTVNESDVSIIVNSPSSSDTSRGPTKVYWLYEPEAIIPEAYAHLKKTNKIVATHRKDLVFHKKILIPPCFPSWINQQDVGMHAKTKIASMIASTKRMCDGHTFRQSVAKKNEHTLDLFGRGQSRALDNKIDGLRDYMFSVAMENSVHDLYFTEKLLDCFLTGTIPVYWGTRTVLDIFDPNGILFVNEDGTLPPMSEEIYQSKIDSVKRNLELAQQHNKTSSDGVQYIVDAL